MAAPRRAMSCSSRGVGLAGTASHGSCVRWASWAVPTSPARSPRTAASVGGGRQSPGAGLHRHGAEPALGRRYHLHFDVRGLVVSGGDPGPVLARNRELVDEHTDHTASGDAGVDRFTGRSMIRSRQNRVLLDSANWVKSVPHPGGIQRPPSGSSANLFALADFVSTTSV